MAYLPRLGCFDVRKLSCFRTCAAVAVAIALGLHAGSAVANPLTAAGASATFHGAAGVHQNAMDTRANSTAVATNYGAVAAGHGNAYSNGAHVFQNGQIQSPYGSTHYSNQGTTLVDSANPRLVVRPSAASFSRGSAAANSGTVAALQAELRAANGNVYALAINNTGIVRANSAVIQGTKVLLVADSGNAEGGAVRAGTVGVQTPAPSVTAAATMALASTSSAALATGTTNLSGSQLPPTGIGTMVVSPVQNGSTTLNNSGTMSAIPIQNGNATLNNIGAVPITMINSGTLTSTGANAFSAGTLTLTGPTTICTGTVTVNGGTLSNSGALTFNAGTTFNNASALTINVGTVNTLFPTTAVAVPINSTLTLNLAGAVNANSGTVLPTTYGALVFFPGGTTTGSVLNLQSNQATILATNVGTVTGTIGANSTLNVQGSEPAVLGTVATAGSFQMTAIPAGLSGLLAPSQAVVGNSTAPYLGTFKSAGMRPAGEIAGASSSDLSGNSK